MANHPGHNLRPRIAAALLALLLLGTTVAFAQLPDFLQVGSRLTWEGGNATFQGARMVPDPNGLYQRNGQPHRLEDTRGGGGIGLIQLNIVASSQEVVIADLRYFLNTDMQRSVHVSTGTDALVGNANGLDEYWLPPARLAAMQPSFNGRTRVTRGARQFAGQTFNVVSIENTGQGSYSSQTYDLVSGLLLFSGTLNTAEGTRITDDNGQVRDFQGTVAQSHKMFLGLRQVNVPWMNQPLPDWATPGRLSFYQGETRAEYNQSTGLPPLGGQQVAVTYAFDRRVGNAVISRAIVQSATTQGLPPLETTSPRVFGSAMLDGLWVPPQAFSEFQPQQLLDQDPYSGHSTFFAGINGNFGVIVVHGAGDSLEQYYDLGSGMLSFSRYRQLTANFGSSVTELQLVGQQ